MWGLAAEATLVVRLTRSRTRRGATSASRGSWARSRPATWCSPASWSGGSTAKTSEPRPASVRRSSTGRSTSPSTWACGCCRGRSGEAGIDLQGASVQIDLEGAGEGSWHWGLGAGETPPPDKKADAFIQGRAAQFALVAAHRIPVDDVLDSGIVVLGGEAEIAELVLRHIRAYA